MKTNKIPIDIPSLLWEKLKGATNKELGEIFGCSPSTISSRMRPYQVKKSLANALYRDYIVNSHRMKLKPIQVQEVSDWIRRNIVLLCANDSNFFSIGQMDYKSKGETIKGRDFTAFVDWLHIKRENL